MRRSTTALLLVASIAGVSFALGCARLGALADDVRAARQGAQHYAAGSVALDRGESARAVRELETAARLVPHASEIQERLGLAHWHAGDRARARAAFEQALALDCDNVAARTHLARLDAFAERGAGSSPGPDERVGGHDDGG